MGWKIELTNGQIICQDESNPGHWSATAEQCHRNKLKIRQFWFNDELIEPDANYYFVIFDLMASPSCEQRIKMGLGSYKASEVRTRITWKPIEGNPVCYTEVMHGTPAYFEDLAIEHEGA